MLSSIFLPLILFIIIVWVLFWLVGKIEVPIIRQVATVVLVVAAILAFLSKFGSMIGIHI